ncbi:bolA-like protein 2 isoform X2 [Ctenopharyngodon idella]|uniref:bolA-like protein 2 isoform X2 n=1 Tax=Ctenopharyngodon idella TaxID=7959 RepID=UPI00222F6E9F|nr:bolA-like protein 2 isoform X2 [Ctenopharyngodon idella]
MGQTTRDVRMLPSPLKLAEDVEDTSPNRCAASFKVLVVSPQFEGKPLLQRHRMVNNCLAEELKEIHAFEQKTLTPEQWEKQKAQ